MSELSLRLRWVKKHDRGTSGHTGKHTDPYVALCFAGATQILRLDLLNMTLKAMAYRFIVNKHVNYYQDPIAIFEELS